MSVPEAAEALRRWGRAEPTGQLVHICPTDPLTLVGVVLSGNWVPGVATN